MNSFLKQGKLINLLMDECTYWLMNFIIWLNSVPVQLGFILCVFT